MHDFDQPVHRRGTGSLKWDRRPDLDPLWVADMDFTSPPQVIETLHERVNHGVFGYAVPHPSLVETLLNYLQTRIGVTSSEEQIVHLGGLVPALSLATKAFAVPGEALLTCTPVYPPFLGVHNDGDLELQSVDHLDNDGTWIMDWDALEQAVTPKSKLFILSNPQNPLGRVFTKDEMIQLGEFCQRHDLVLISDEIHCDLILDEESTPHFSALNLPYELRERTVTLLAPSKTYNIAGLGYAFAVIPNDSLRRKFTAAKGHILPEINCLAYYAAEAAYRHGEPWRQDLLAYLRTNRDLLTKKITEGLPGARVPNIEATYLAWIDCKALSVDQPIEKAEEAGLFLSDGAFFGHKRCLRVNFGTQTARLENALDLLVTALRS
jgi:cystathionine beta-lyase